MSWIKENQRSSLYTLACWCLCAAVVLHLAMPARAADGVSGIRPARQKELVQLVLQDCGSCHGLTLKGGLGPPLTPEALAGKPPEWLRTTILDGRTGTPMPPWRPFLTEQEAGWVVESLMRGTLDTGK